MIGLASVLGSEVAEIPLIEVLAPSEQDVAAVNTVIESAGAQAIVCRSAAEVGERFNDAVSAMILVEEALDDDAIATLAECVQRQPTWSDIPIILLSGSKGRDGPQARWILFQGLGNVSVLERPLHPQSLLIAIRSALRGRAWQRVVKKQMDDLARAADELEQRVQERTASLYAVIEERRQLELALAEARKMESIGRLTGGVAHDFNNILQIIAMSSTILGQEPAMPGPMRERAVQAIQRAADRGAKLTHQLLAFARRQPLQPMHFSLKQKLLGMADYLEHMLEDRIGLVLDLPHALWEIKADPTQLEAALLNLIINAKEAMREGGTLSIAARNLRLPSSDQPKAQQLRGDFVILTLTDSGPGMPQEVANQAFEPFFTTKESGRTGLGLSQVYGFATQSGGSVWIDRPERGTSISLALPRSDQDEQRDASGVMGDVPARTAFPGLRVLCVEDNDQLADVTVSVLGQLGCIVDRAASAEEALERPLEGFDLVFSDVSMPGDIDGIDLARLVAARQPQLPVVLTSGYMIAPDRLEHAGALFLPKPYTIGDLRSTLSRAVAKARYPLT